MGKLTDEEISSVLNKVRNTDMQRIDDYFHTARAAGHTTAVIDGAKIQNNIGVIVPDHENGQYIAREVGREDICYTPRQLRMLENRPMLIEPYTVQIAWRDALCSLKQILKEL